MNQNHDLRPYFVAPLAVCSCPNIEYSENEQLWYLVKNFNFLSKNRHCANLTDQLECEKMISFWISENCCKSWFIFNGAAMVCYVSCDVALERAKELLPMHCLTSSEALSRVTFVFGLPETKN